MEKREHYALEPKLIEQAIFVGFAFSGPQKKEKKITIIQKILHSKQKKKYEKSIDYKTKYYI